MRQNYSDNLLNLWAHLENIGKHHDEYIVPPQRINIKNSVLERDDFLNSILSKKPDCSLDCNLTCNICYEVNKNL